MLRREFIKWIASTFPVSLVFGAKLNAGEIGEVDESFIDPVYGKYVRHNCYNCYTVIQNIPFPSSFITVQFERYTLEWKGIKFSKEFCNEINSMDPKQLWTILKCTVDANNQNEFINEVKIYHKKGWQKVALSSMSFNG